MTSVGEALVVELENRGVSCVFGIPGVHTIELYRVLATSSIRHVTPRHEQGAGFMADGYARVSGKPGVAFVITGPGLTNTLTAMGQARADSVPMLVVSGVNALPSLGNGLGHLHELPDQQGLARKVALVSERVETPKGLSHAINSAFGAFQSGRPGPVHIEIPLDVAGQDISQTTPAPAPETVRELDTRQIALAADLLATARSPVLLAGGGARTAALALRDLAERLDAPVVQTVNARGVLYAHPLGVPASPSLGAVRDLIDAADVVLAIGTELGPTDYDMYASGTMPKLNTLIRIDLCPDQLTRHPAEVPILGDATDALTALNTHLGGNGFDRNGATRADQARSAAFDEIGSDMQALNAVLNIIRDTIPAAIIVGDSAQPIYAGNLFYDHDRPGGWFNAATGFGALGYGIPAAIGAAMADPTAPVICLTGDGGAQFSLPELMCAVDENLPITFVIWNNYGYQEIATSMLDAGVTVVGCDPTPPDFEHVARSCGMPFWRCDPGNIARSLRAARDVSGPTLIEIQAPNSAHPL
ncbi:5-guanidino-2-oxopentanoate decarboxylase [Aliiroseovarius sp. F47248L]|uniref:5-guanidino-2-oxopentanoate decarboxylase n=1 Tax=Aliiroseovarius sp. F47248L TaxID=2926420 RepID=UPI001FF6B87D|nr:5-guanidino-2-oxopentanoate decarboxylase [Aliiroseovarius sp. F47248L]MCK0138497.1 5-guanidino-2-oxopentanoate decarboxylase [Aliiroseovarius sp. F47248L]